MADGAPGSDFFGENRNQNRSSLVSPHNMRARALTHEESYK
jgi:hypothetical protein